MTDIVRIEKIDATYIKVTSDPGIRQEIATYFRFRPTGYQFTPKYKNRVWDGYIYLYNPMKPYLYTGLLSYLLKFCEERDYQVEIDQDLLNKAEFSKDDLDSFLSELQLPLEPRDYQIDYILNAIQNNRSLSLSPTSSGKSLCIYCIQQFYYRTFGHRTLIIVPTIGLVYQMANDFIRDYGCDPSEVYTIKGGVDKNTQHPIVVSTWQSLIKQPKEWFDQFRVIIGDEAHLYQAKSLQEIMSKCIHANYRHGFTGTISSDSKVHKLILEGVFGSIKKFISTKNLIDRGTVADFKINALVLKYSDEEKKKYYSMMKALKGPEANKKYSSERSFLFANEKRNLFIRNLVWSLQDKNNLILFDQIENQGNVLKELLKKEGRILHYIHGGTSGEEREKLRSLIENDPLKQHDILASSGVFSTGVSIKRLDTIVFTSAGKSEIRTLQSIGRTLRKGNGSDHAVLYDITDDLSVKAFSNYSLRHFERRIEIYNQEQFPYKIYTINL